MITAVQNNPSYTLDEIIDGYNEMCGNEGFSHGCPFGDFDCAAFDSQANIIIDAVKQHLNEKNNGMD